MMADVFSAIGFTVDRGSLVQYCVGAIYEYLTKTMQMVDTNVCLAAEQITPATIRVCPSNSDLLELCSNIMVPVTLVPLDVDTRVRVQDTQTQLITLAINALDKEDASRTARFVYSRICLSNVPHIYRYIYTKRYKHHHAIHHTFVEIISGMAVNLTSFTQACYAYIVSHTTTFEEIDKFVELACQPCAIDNAYGNTIKNAMIKCDIRPVSLSGVTTLPNQALWDVTFFSVSDTIYALSRADWLIVVLYCLYVERDTRYLSHLLHAFPWA